MRVTWILKRLCVVLLLGACARSSGEDPPPPLKVETGGDTYNYAQAAFWLNQELFAVGRFFKSIQGAHRRMTLS